MPTDTTIAEKLTIEQLRDQLADWIGVEARVEMSHRSSLADFGCVPQARLEGIHPMPPALAEVGGDGLLLAFIDQLGDANLTLVLYEHLFDHAVEFEQELLIFLADVELILDRGD